MDLTINKGAFEIKLCEAKSSLETLLKYLDTDEKLPFELAEGICDIIPILEAQAKKYDLLISKFVKSYYEFSETENVWKIKENTEDGRSQAASEQMKIDTIEFNKEKIILPKPRNIAPKVLMVLREFFLFE